LERNNVTVLEAAKKYTAWLHCNTRPEHAAKMRLYWAQVLRHKANIAVSAAQDGMTEQTGEDNDQR